jgi:hypothetical protein
MVSAWAPFGVVQRSELLGTALAPMYSGAMAGSPVTGTDFVTVFVKDYAAAKEFYGVCWASRTRSTTGKSRAASSRPATSPCR